MRKEESAVKNKTDVSVMLREAGILFAITLIAGLVLGLVNELTKDRIRIQQEKAVQEACAAVFQTAASFEETEYEPDEALTEELSGMGVKIGSVFRALDSDGSSLGVVVESTSTGGYGGNIVLYLGVTNEGMLNDISILEISETPGLGMLAPEVLAPQFHEKNVDSFAYTKTGAVSENEIDAIAGATITTKAVTNAVNGGLRAARALTEGGAANE
ncbi:MAG: RnfABCDGE type electron transport complex subunit G [Lachnospiraceae bacterium]|nr:RnfABCDGE type electron transport complex subunit G [Lachnospiraceae bacterium]